MKVTFKAKMVIEAEYEADSDNYPGCLTIGEMVAIDRDSFISEPSLLLDIPGSTLAVEITNET